MAKFNTLREANKARTIEWTGGAVALGHLWRATELCGEIGELAELLMDEEHPDYQGFKDRLSEEIADGLICVDLSLMDLGLDPLPFGKAHVPPAPRHYLASSLGIVAGMFANVCKKLERESRGWPGSRSTPEQAGHILMKLHCLVLHVADRYAVDPEEAVRAKFNRTSEAVGLTTRLVAPEPATI